MFDLKFYPALEKETKKIVLPISMGNPVFTKDVIKALLDALVLHDVTVLVCDYLNRHNVGEEEAMQMGERFLEKCSDLFAQYTNLTVIRWKDWIAAHEEAYTNAYNNVLKLKEENKLLQRAMMRTAKAVLKKNTPKDVIAASLAYQCEEFAVLACMEEYDQTLYPGPIAYGMGSFYKYGNISRPKYVQCKLNKVNKNLAYMRANYELQDSAPLYANELADNGFFSVDNTLKSPKVSKSSKNPQTQVLQMGSLLYLHGFQEFIFSPRVSKQEKEEMLYQLKRLIYHAENQFDISARDEEQVPVLSTTNSLV